MTIAVTIIPIFAVIGMGWIARKRGFLPAAFLEPANRLVFYLAIPAMIFRAVTRASLKSEINLKVLLVLSASVGGVFCFSWAMTRLFRIGKGQRGTFIQSTIHGNQGYIGLAVVYYHLGEAGFAAASIIAGLLIILQNFLAVFTLQYHHYKGGEKRGIARFLLTVLTNPIIVSAGTGIVFSFLEIRMPLILDRMLKILSSLALPTALLIIGASITVQLLKKMVGVVSAISFIKLILLPATGYAAFTFFNIPSSDYLAALILLSAPTATVTVVMAGEIGGDPKLAVAAISGTTLISMVTFGLWLGIG